MKTFKQFNEESITHHDKLSEEIGNPFELLPLAAVKYGPKIVQGAKATAKFAHKAIGRPLVRKNLRTGVKFNAPLKPKGQGGAFPGVGLLRQAGRLLTSPAAKVSYAKDAVDATADSIRRGDPANKVAGTALGNASYVLPGKYGLTALATSPIISYPKTSKAIAQYGLKKGKELFDKVKSNLKLKNVKKVK